MTHEHIINTEGLSASGYDFAVLHNALLVAGYSASTALDVAAKIHGQSFAIECKCK